MMKRWGGRRGGEGGVRGWGTAFTGRRRLSAWGPQVLSVHLASKPAGGTAAELIRLEEKTVLMDHTAIILVACACVWATKYSRFPLSFGFIFISSSLKDTLGLEKKSDSCSSLAVFSYFTLPTFHVFLGTHLPSEVFIRQLSLCSFLPMWSQYVYMPHLLPVGPAGFESNAVSCRIGVSLPSQT